MGHSTLTWSHAGTKVGLYGWGGGTRAGIFWASELCGHRELASAVPKVIQAQGYTDHAATWAQRQHKHCKCMGNANITGMWA